MHDPVVYGRFNMSMHIYEPSAERDEFTGQKRRSWEYEVDGEIDYEAGIVVPCIARRIMGGGIRVVGSTEQWGEEYQPVDWVKIQLPKEHMITKRHRIGNIRDTDGNLQWVTNDGNPVIFNVIGAMPVEDPFGQTIERDVLAKKAANIRVGEPA